MEQTEITPQTLTSYLLGRLAEPQRAALEEECFTEREKYHKLCEAENALIDDYVRGYLSRADCALFEQHFLSVPARRERVKIAATLMQEIDQRTPAPEFVAGAARDSRLSRLLSALRGPQAVMTFALAMMLLVAAGGFWLFRQSRQLREQIAQSEANSSTQQRRIRELEQMMAANRAENSQLTAELERLRQQRQMSSVTSPPRTILFALDAGTLRSDGQEAQPSLRLSPAVQQVTLQVRTGGNNYAAFSVSLRTAEGREINRWSGVPKQGSRMKLTLPAKKLSAGDYVLIISGISQGRLPEEVRRLPFRISR
ncbi:MAG: hypothetical protein U0Z53_31695 [Blastocatellia bacterium]